MPSPVRIRGSVLGAAALLVLTLVLPGCGGDGSTSTTTSTSTKTVELRPKESSDPLPKLDRGWEVVHSHSGGFALGRPPGWQPKHSGASLTVLAPDRLVAVTVSANRSPSGLAIPAKKFATRTAASLPGFDGKLKPSKPRLFRHRYEAAQVVERARSKSGIPQEIRVIVMRRTELATFTAVIARNAKRPDAQENKQALKIVRTVRSRPMTKGESPGKGKDAKKKKG